MTNFKIRKLEDDIIAILNQSDTTIEAKRLVVSDVLHIVTKEADKEIQRELKEAANDKRNDTDDHIENKES